MTLPKTGLLLLLLLSFPFIAIADAAERCVPFVLHVQSTFSEDGTQSAEQIAATARKDGIPVVIFSDHALMRFSYGIWPLHHLLKRTVTRASVLAAGPARYMQAIADANRKYPELLLIPGVEAAPFYYWSGAPFKGLTLNSWHKHLLITGMPQPDDYRRLPLCGNERCAGRPDIRLLWPVVLILAGCVFLNRSRAAGIVLALAGIVLSVNNYPFKRLPFDQYHGDKGEQPYQAVIDYVRRTAPDTGLVFWAHPEAPNFEKGEKVGHVSFRTEPYPGALLDTDGYTGFAYFQEGEKTVGRPGGTWDRILTDYVNGKRKAPVWAVAELDYRAEGLLGTRMDSFVNMLLLQRGTATTAGTVLTGIKKGSFYALRKPANGIVPVLDDFSLSEGARRVTMGATLSPAHDPVMTVALHMPDWKPYPVTLTVISNGKVITTVQSTTPATLTLPLPRSGGPAYYRCEIISGGAKIVTNPLFVR